MGIGPTTRALEWNGVPILLRACVKGNLEVGDGKKWHRTMTWQKLLEKPERYVKWAHKELETKRRKFTSTTRVYSPVRSYLDGGQNDARDYC